MKLLIIIGAGASFDCLRPELSYMRLQRLPLAKDLFAMKDPQEKLLRSYRLMDLADKLKEIVDSSDGDSIDLEAELEIINDKAVHDGDEDTQLSLFNTRFYIQNLIHNLSETTDRVSESNTAYVRMLRKLKEWILKDPANRSVEIISFNYDDLLERAMSHVYKKAWNDTSLNLEMYYRGENLKIYKPHGSVNWGREMTSKKSSYIYAKAGELAQWFGNFDLSSDFQYVAPQSFEFESNKPKDYVPAIAIPFKKKDTFDECPEEMLNAMKNAVAASDTFITIGWKGGDAHLVELLKKNENIKSFYTVSPSGSSELDYIPMRSYRVGFSDFVYGNITNETLDSFLKENALQYSK